MCVIAALISWTAALPPGHITVYLVGDSTMAIKEKKAYPETGWGMPFTVFIDTTVTVDNRAKNGRSTKTFITEGLWQPIVENLKPGDFVLIQFGHNDEVPTKRSYTTESQFTENLKRYITDVRNKKATPLLLTPVARRKFDDAGNVVDTHAAYAELVRNVAAQNKVTLIDLSKISMDMLQKLGPDKSVLLYNHLEPGENPNYPDGKQDDTHFSELGARKVAELVLAQIRQQLPVLASRIVKTPSTAK